MKNRLVMVLAGLVLFLMVGYSVVRANSGPIPYREASSNVVVFELDSGHTCVTDYRNGNPYTQCFCDCESGCVEVVNTITERVDKTQIPIDVPDTPVPPTPEPTEKPKCNSGRGNGSEGEPDCDPGNSGKNKGGD